MTGWEKKPFNDTTKQSLVWYEIAVVAAEVGGDVVAAGDEQGVGAGVQGVGVIKVVPRKVPPILGHLNKQSKFSFKGFIGEDRILRALSLTKYLDGLCGMYLVQILVWLLSVFSALDRTVQMKIILP